MQVTKYAGRPAVSAVGVYPHVIKIWDCSKAVNFAGLAAEQTTLKAG